MNWFFFIIIERKSNFDCSRLEASTNMSGFFEKFRTHLQTILPITSIVLCKRESKLVGLKNCNPVKKKTWRIGRCFLICFPVHICFLRSNCFVYLRFLYISEMLWSLTLNLFRFLSAKFKALISKVVLFLLFHLLLTFSFIK